MNRLRPGLLRGRRIARVVAVRQSRPIRHFYHDLREEAGFLTEAIGGRIASFRREELHPARRAVGREWQAFRSVVAEDGGMLGRSASTAIGWWDSTAKVVSSWSSSRDPRSSPTGPKAIWRSLRQARDLIFDSSRESQMVEIGGSKHAL